MAEIPAHEFIRHFGLRYPIERAAPGRVNLIGEHTDYCDGFVLPTVIPQQTRVAVARNDDARVRAFSHAVPFDQQRATFEVGTEAVRGHWVDYVQGVTAVARARGLPVGGFDTVISSDVPLGSGLSSSAALVVALLRALRDLQDWTIEDEALATLARHVETEFLGIPVGAMDPFACMLGQPDTALWLDTRSLAWERVPLPSGLSVVVINSGIRHSHATGAYRQRQQECADAAARLGLPALRDATDAHTSAIGALPEPLNRRARHVVSENARVLEAVGALRRRNVVQVGALLNASHASLRDDFEVSTAEVDAMVDIARADAGVLGARITGGGFGGAIVVLTRAGQAERVADLVTHKARTQLLLDAETLVPAPVPGSA